MNGPSSTEDRRLIAGGTHEPDVPASVFDGMPCTALRVEKPDARVIDFVSDYYVLDSVGPEVMGAVEWAMPGAANIRFYFGDRPYDVRIGNREFSPIPETALYGPTGRALRFETFGGVTIGMGITPLGWARLFRKPAQQFCDRIVPLTEAISGDFAERLRHILDQSDKGAEVKPLLDAFFLHALWRSHPDEALIRSIMKLIVDETVGRLSDIADRLELTAQQLRTISLRYFGFPPKRLLRRARFLRSLLRMYAQPGEPDYNLRSRSYFDVSHFLRDAEEFLGMTPRRFMAMQTPYMRHILQARMAVLGVPTQALYPVSDGNEPE